MTATRSTDAASRGSAARVRRVVAALACSGIVIASGAFVAPVTAKDHWEADSQAVVTPAIRSDVSALTLGEMTVAPAVDVKEKKERKKNELPEVASAGGTDTALQTQPGGGAAPAAMTGFEGIGVGLGTYSPRWAPPDTYGAVGPSHYFEIVNADIAVFSKTGTLLYGPAPTNTLWSGFGGGCETRDDGDGIVEYDRGADRWVVTQFVNDGSNTECVAVSTSGDPLGSWARYSFTYPAFPDYPKLSVWPDAYYITFNLFGSSGFAGGMVCAYDRAKMLAAQPATQQCFNLGTGYGGLLPSDLDGSTPPPAGSPNFVLNYGSNRLNLWKFHVDWTTPTNTTMTGPTAISVASFSPACGGACIPQPITSQRLDSLSDRLMSRLAYRNFGGYESLVVNHSVGTGFLNLGPSGVRWYELRNPNGTPAVYQQGTYAPDSVHRWMGSIAQDRQGNMALGYSASSSSLFPSIRYTGRLVTDALGTMQPESTVITGGGAQLANLSRWGDYSSMTVDPVDDCTFWYANEYLKANGTWNWSTRISSFKFAGCDTAAPPVLTTIAVAPASASVQTTKTQQFSATGYDQYGALLSPQPTFTWSVSGGGSISASGLFTAGSTAGGPFTVTAASGGVNGTASVTVTSLPPDFSLSVNPTSQSVRRGRTATYTVTITRVNGFSGAVTLSLTGQPAGSTVSFTPNPATSTTSTLTVRTLSTTTRQTYALTITGVSGSLSHTTTAALNVTK